MIYFLCSEVKFGTQKRYQEWFQRQVCLNFFFCFPFGDRRMPVFGRLNDRGVESYEVEEGMSKIKGGKVPG